MKFIMLGIFVCVHAAMIWGEGPPTTAPPSPEMSSPTNNQTIPQTSKIIDAETILYDENLLDFIEENNLRLSWDSVYNMGFIQKDSNIVSFQPGLPYVLVNFSAQKFIDPVKKKRGILLTNKVFLDFLTAVLIDNSYAVVPDTDTTSKNISNDDGKTLEAITRRNNEGEYEALNTPPSDTFNQVVTLVIDPGHGGKTPGAIGRFTYNKKSYTVMEKDIVLEVSKQVVKKMKAAYPKMNVVMTRNQDKYISLEERTVVANKYLDKLGEGEGMLFVSIHANAALTKQASGYEVWYLPPEYRRDDLVSKDLNYSKIHTIINSLREEEITLESRRLAELVIGGLKTKIGGTSRNRGVKEEKFFVVRNTKMPAVLIELGFITNPQEGYNLTLKKYRENLSDGIVRGLDGYLQLFEKTKR